MKSPQELFTGKKVLITGAAGTIGSRLVGQLSDWKVEEIMAVDNDESAMFFLSEKYRKKPNVRCLFGDVRHKERMTELCKGIDIVLHLAALKHVIIGEMSPIDAIKTNVDGTANIIQAAIASDSVSHVLFTSSDKAVNPTNVMGSSKLLGERLVSAALNIRNDRDIIFASTRFGNVFGSKGSVAQIFHKQIRAKETITVTNEQMTRFFMTIDEAADLVLRAAFLAKGGEVLVTKMPVIRIVDLAQAMIEHYAPKYGHKPTDFKIDYIGAKPGEKMYEELMTTEEIPRARELESVFTIRPAWPAMYQQVDYSSYNEKEVGPVTNPYISANEECWSVEEIRKFLVKAEASSEYLN